MEKVNITKEWQENLANEKYDKVMELVRLEKELNKAKGDMKLLELKGKIAELSRPEALDNLSYLMDSKCFDSEMWKLILTMMQVYDETKSIDTSDLEGAKISDNANHGVAKRYVGYFSKYGLDYVYDWDKKASGHSKYADKYELYNQFLNKCDLELDNFKQEQKPKKAI